MLQHKSEFIDEINLKELLERMKLKKVIGTNHYNEWIGEKPEKQAEFLVQKIPDKGLDGFKALLSCLWLEEPEFADKLLASLGNENKKCEQSIRKELSGDVGDSGPLDEYNMTSIPRGQALIININKFEGKTKNREGSKIDKTAMETLLKYKLQFEVTVAKDLKLDEMKKKLKDFAEMSDEHKRGDCCIVVIMSHGDQRPGSHPKGPYPFVISSSDEKHLEVEQIVQMFNNVDALKGKPKVFIIQACRASEGSPFELSFEDIKFLNDGIEMDGGTFNPHDTFVVTSTIPYHFAGRDVEKGSFFIQSICKVFGEFASTKDFQTMMKRVNHEVAVQTEKSGLRQCPSVEIRGRHKTLHFHGS